MQLTHRASRRMGVPRAAREIKAYTVKVATLRRKTALKVSVYRLGVIPLLAWSFLDGPPSYHLLMISSSILDSLSILCLTV